MPSEKAAPWTMFTFDLLPYAGKNITIEFSKTAGFESYILAERLVKTSGPASGNNILWTITNDTRRQTVRVF